MYIRFYLQPSRVLQTFSLIKVNSVYKVQVITINKDFYYLLFIVKENLKVASLAFIIFAIHEESNTELGVTT